ncbi:MAG: lysophospholipid acyltransferase family protein [Chloroflexota bacterium]
MKHWSFYLSKFLCWLVFRVVYGLKVTGQERVPAVGPVILAANHVSNLDPPLVGAACPRRVTFLAQTELFRHGLLGAYMRSVHVIPLKRDEGDLSAIRAATAQLARGEAIVIFPEGGRQLSGQLGSAKRGVGFLAMKARAPIVPVLLQGTLQALPPRAKWLCRSKIRVAFGEPIPYTNGSPPSARRGDGQRGGDSAHTTRQDQERLAEAVTQRWRELAQQLER